MPFDIRKYDKTNNGTVTGRVDTLTIANNQTGKIIIKNEYIMFVTGIWIGPIKHSDITLFEMINSDMDNPVWVPIQVSSFAGNETEGFRLKNDIFHMEHSKGIKIEIVNKEAQDTIYYYSVVVKETHNI